MYRHIVLYRLKDPSGAEALKEKFLTLKGNVPQVRELEVGIDTLRSPRSYDVCLSVLFEKAEDLPAYKAHPFHVKVSEYVHAVIASSVSCDYEEDR